MEGEAIQVLCVEDELDIAMLTREMLEQEGMRVTLARDGAEALAQLDHLSPDVIVTDLMMPVLDGFAFLARYRERPGHHAPVVAVSAFTAYLETARSLGADAVLAKPFDIDDLVRVVRGLAKGRRAASTTRRANPEEEARRLAAVLELALEQPMPPEFDAFTRRVAAIFDVPICLVSIVTEDRQYWSAFCGLPEDLAKASGTPRRISFCTHAVAARAALVVQDTLENPFFRDNPLVRTRGLRFYAGVPLSDHQGNALGTLCLIGFEPRPFTHFDLELLGVLAERVSAEIEEREHDRTPTAPASAFPRLGLVDRELGIFGRRLFASIVAAQAARHADARQPLTLALLAVAPDRLEHVLRTLEGALPTAEFGRLATGRLAVVTPGLPTEIGRTIRTLVGADLMRDAVGELSRAVGSSQALLRHLELILGTAGLQEPASGGDARASRPSAEATQHT